jgi:hypothetical protein
MRIRGEARSGHFLPPVNNVEDVKLPEGHRTSTSVEDDLVVTH